ncbi:MAG: hypothetical protein IH840_15180 [Candidatus Heimdallarchaeota archaeon]|nr:hypothetical protein [Candidatus Heimdallarchaeota archaeon]
METELTPEQRISKLEARIDKIENIVHWGKRIGITFLALYGLLFSFRLINALIQ